ASTAAPRAGSPAALRSVLPRPPAGSANPHRPGQRTGRPGHSLPHGPGCCGSGGDWVGQGPSSSAATPAAWEEGFPLPVSREKVPSISVSWTVQPAHILFALAIEARAANATTSPLAPLGEGSGERGASFFLFLFLL